jgi:hypothetical protein
MKTTDFITEHNAFIAQDASEMHTDHEVQMARADCYHAADYAIKLHKILAQANDNGNIEGWVSEKITLANDYLRTVYEYLSYEDQEVDLHAMPTFALESAEAQLQAALEEGYSMADVQRDAEANARKSVDRMTAPQEKTPFMAQVGKKIVGGVAGAVKGAYKGFTGQVNEINPHNYDSDEDYYNALNAPSKPKYRGTSSPGVNPDDEAYFREIFRKNREAAARAQQEKDQGVTEGVAETMPMDDAMKVLRHYGAGHFKTTSNELHFYKNGQPFSVDLTLGADSVRSVSLSQLNQAARQLKGQGLAEDKQTVSEMTAGGTGAGGFATGAAGGTGKPGTGVPKRVKNVAKRLTPKIGTGIYK